MTTRFTETEKWKDGWFLDLSVQAKALFEYLRDNCDIAGFIERNDRVTLFMVRLEKDEIEGAYKELQKSLAFSGCHIWVRNFIYHQRNLPLEPRNNSHRTIIKLLLDRSEAFGSKYQDSLGYSVEELRGLLGAYKPLTRGLSKSKGKSNSKGRVNSEQKEKHVYGEFKHVLLTDEEMAKLVAAFGKEKTAYWIKKVDEGVENKGYKYKNFYLTIKNWQEREAPNARPIGYTKGDNTAGKVDASKYDKAGIPD